MPDSEPQNPPSESSNHAASTSKSSSEKRPIMTRSIMLSETLKFEVDPSDEVQTRKQLGLDSRYPIGPSGRAVAGSKRAAKALDGIYGVSKDAQSNGTSDSNPGGQVKVPWGVNPPKSFNFGTINGNGDVDTEDTVMS